MLKVAVLVSGGGTDLQSIMDACAAKEINAEVKLVISNRKSAYGLERARLAGIRAEWIKDEDVILQCLEEMEIDLVVLAGYLAIVSDKLINRYENRIINIHHSFLPAFVGAKPYHAAYDRGVKLIGATSHYVTTELDAGPIIEQDIVRITHKDTINDLVKKGRDLEKIVLSRAVEKHIQRKILTYNNKTVVFS